MPSLQGVSALVTRPARQAEALVAAVHAAGGSAASFPLLDIQPFGPDDPQQAAIARVLAELPACQIAIFISSNAVHAALGQMQARGSAWPASLVCVAIGRATAAVLLQADIAPHSGGVAMNSEELLTLDVLREVAGRRVVIFKGAGGRGLLSASLRERGAIVTECPLYRRVAPAAAASELRHLLRRQAVNALLISSGEGLDNLLGLLADAPAGTMAQNIALVVPGDRVAQRARACGFARIEVAANATDQEMLAALGRLATRIRAAPEQK